MADQPCAIQPHGFLLALSDDWLVEHASLNVGDFLGRDPRGLIGSPASSLLSVDAIHALRNRLALLRGPDAVERLFRCRLIGDDLHFDVAVHRSGGSTLVEAEPCTGQSYGDITGAVRGMIERLDHDDSLEALLETGARQLRAMTGFDRIVIARFGDNKGEVVAECARGGIGTMLGEQLPPARHRRAALELVADSDAAPVAMVPRSAASGQPLDLSLAVLRAPSPQRIEALRARGAKAAMSIALNVGGRAWGLIDCHHHFARIPGFERRAMADLFAQMFAMRVRISELERQSARQPLGV
ncbi:MAG: GAF domain-containing protein [Sphingomonadales bacterium]|nr:GAF domain-containing protein [Sphingomonadales bacterium]